MNDNLKMLEWQQRKDSGILVVSNYLSVDVTFFLLDASYPINTPAAPQFSKVTSAIKTLEHAHQYIRASYNDCQFYGPVVKLNIPFEAYNEALNILGNAIVDICPSKYQEYIG